ncbi:hypothetical protein [Streptomyces mexicanus]|uniref:baeRF2 domain-containing protein n=1 Tax=Streptomyces mexicanus TaxID=178566 RepID=UPI0031E7E6B7
MKLSFLEPVTGGPGPWASVHLDTSRDVEDPDRAVALRWRRLRAALRAQGADEATIGALDDVVAADRGIPGRHGQALFAAHGRLGLAGELPDPPAHDTARFGPLADTLPVALAHAPDIPYLAVVLTRTAPPPGPTADTREDGAGQVLVVGEAGRWPMSRIAPGRRLSRRLPVADWPRSAHRVARELADLADDHQAEVVVVCRDAGDTWLSGVLVNRLPIRLQNSLTIVENDASDRIGLSEGHDGTEQTDVSDPGDRSEASEEHDDRRAADDRDDEADDGTGSGHPAGRALAERHVARVLDGCLSKADERHVDVFFTQRARHRHRSEGIAAAVTALQRGQAQAVLLSPPLRLPEHLWTGTRPDQIALTAAEPASFGSGGVREEPAGSALLHAAVRTGADLVVLPPDETPLTDSVGVVLRYRDVTDMTVL